MPKYQINITEIAEQDLFETVEYIALDNLPAVLQLADEIEQNILRLEDFPLLGVIPKNRRLAIRGYRILIVSDYLVFYVIDGETIEVRRILSGKRNYTKLF